MRTLPIHNLSTKCECEIVAQITVSETNKAENNSKNGVEPIVFVSQRVQNVCVCACVWVGEAEPKREATQSGQIISVLNVTGFN